MVGPVDDGEGVDDAAGTAGVRDGGGAPDAVPYFVGEFDHRVDDKGRVFMPSVFRPALSEGCYVTWGRDGCISVYAPDEFSRVAGEVNQRAREGGAAAAAADAFFAAASQVALDGQGRITVADRLLDHAGLSRSSEVTVTGAGRRIQLWHPDRWQKRRVYGVESIANDLALAGFGY